MVSAPLLTKSSLRNSLLLAIFIVVLAKFFIAKDLVRLGDLCAKENSQPSAFFIMQWRTRASYLLEFLMSSLIARVLIWMFD
jgi:hypothetical protein